MTLPQNYSGTFTEIWGRSKRFLFAPMDSKNVTWLAVKNAPVGEKEEYVARALSHIQPQEATA